ncbi:FAD-dependent monooxygenase [Streptomyces sp. NPDC002851]
MKIACVGGGPASLYLSILLKLHDPAHEVSVFERSRAGSTYGWGVTFWPDTLALLDAYDAVSARDIRTHAVRWQGGRAFVRDEVVQRDGDAGYAIGRHRMLDILAERAQSLGVRTEFGTEITDRSDRSRVADADLVVAADGVHSTLRSQHATYFGTRVQNGTNRFLWLGTTKVFTTFSFAFADTPHGWIWCYAYGFSEDRSTCVVECAETTWRGLELDTMPRDDCLRLLEKYFARLLDGHCLIAREDRTGSGHQWQTFRTVTNSAWSHGNLVLLGDAAHTTHYSIGAGTALALRDAVTLAEELRTAPAGALTPALARYEQRRRQALLPVQSAARLSARWYEELPRYLRLPPERMFALLGQRHSPLLPYLPPTLYYGIDHLADRLHGARRLKRWLGPRLGGALQRRRAITRR